MTLYIYTLNISSFTRWCGNILEERRKF